MKKNIFAVLLLGFLFSLSFAAEELDENMIKCDDPKVLALVEKKAQRELQFKFDRYLTGLTESTLVKDKYVPVYVSVKYEKDLDDYFHSIKLELSSFVSGKLEKQDGPYGLVTYTRKCRADMSITFPEAPQFLRKIQDIRVRDNLVREFSMNHPIEFKTSFDGDTHNIGSRYYRIVQEVNPNIIKQKDPRIEDLWKGVYFQ